MKKPPEIALRVTRPSTERARFRFPRRKPGEASPWPVEAVHRYLVWDQDTRRAQFGSTRTELPAGPRAALVRHLLEGCNFTHLSTVSTRVGRWYQRGLTDAEADNLAVSLGHHPVDIWPEWFTIPLEPDTT